MVTDYDCWHPNHDDVTVDAVVKVLFDNADRARALVRRAAPRIGGDKSAAECDCRSALEHAIITAPDKRDPELMKRLSVVAGRILKKEKPA
jgi:5'-methylthioadenosine phosphorylase